jgi:sec-independent protein translocase protein TatA
MEIAVIAIIALIVLGPKRLPEMGRSVGKGLREFKSAVSLDPGDDDDERPNKKKRRAEERETESVSSGT